MLRYLNFALWEAVSSLWRSRVLNLLSIGTVMFAMFILGSFVFVGINLKEVTVNWQDQIQFNLFLKDEVTELQVAEFREFLVANPNINEIEFISREEARFRFDSDFSGYRKVVSALDENPFPASFQISMVKGTERVVFDNLRTALQEMDGVEEIYYDQEIFKRLNFFANLIQLAGWFFGGIMIFSSIFTISNVLKLTFFTRREEVDIMKLVGASRAYIRGPFIIEGLLIGVLGSTLGVMLVYLGYLGLRYYLNHAEEIIAANVNIVFLSPNWIGLLVLSGGISGLLGSLISLHQFLEEHISYH